MKCSFRKLYKILPLVLFLLLIHSFYIAFAASISATLTNRTELTELNLNDAVIRITLSGSTFVSPINTANFTLANAPNGTTKKSVALVNSTTVDLTLSFTGQDFDSSITNFNIKVLKAGIVSGTADLVTPSMTIAAMIEKITPSSNPNPLRENSLNGSTVTLTVENDTLKDSITLNSSYFSLHTARDMPSTISITGVQKLSSTQVKLTLGYDGTDFDVDQLDFRIKLLKTALVRNTNDDLETDNIAIYYDQEKIIVTSLNPDPLEETTLNNSEIYIYLNGDSFITDISTKFQLVNPVSGLSIIRVDRLSNTEARVVLSFNGTDFDADKTNFAIKFAKSGLVRTYASTDLQTTPMIIYAVNEGVPTLSMTTHPTQLFETNLGGSTLDLILREDSFKSSLYPNYFQLNNAPTGTYIHKVTFINSRSAILELRFDAVDFDTDIDNLNLTALPTALASGSTLTSNDVIIKANKEIDGQGYYTVTGESYPTKIQLAGYNSRNNKLFLNIDLVTQKTVLAGQTAIYKYFVEIFDANGNLIGNLGSIDTPVQAVGASSVQIQNLQIQTNMPLPNGYRVVASVSRVTIQ